jgi:hypothetical protein
MWTPGEVSRGSRALRVTVAACHGGAAYALLWGGDILRLGEVVVQACPRDPGVALAALVEALVEAARLRATALEITAPASIAIAVKRSIAGLRPVRGPAAEAWEVYRDIVLAVLERFESWEFREGSDLDPTYATLEVLCDRAAARAPPRRDWAAAALVCTGPLSELQERAPRRYIRAGPHILSRGLGQRSPGPAGAEAGGAPRASLGEGVRT